MKEKLLLVHINTHQVIIKRRVCWIHHVTGVWVYPLLEHLSPGVKIIFFAAVTVVINIFYVMGEVLNNYIWDTQKCEYCFRNINA
ncbi:hypothetical protein CIB84_007760 [Bambusicola thoracicus]|uniref:Uncharacterized protein n=1 Tax=Bambusicola thoracicus TaxID=9083 RepID=A0A2P4SWM3_BAMTH|nr:hypothetical protein CIB84_007760 [Bambusicola thoracicus]